MFHFNEVYFQPCFWICPLSFSYYETKMFLFLYGNYLAIYEDKYIQMFTFNCNSHVFISLSNFLAYVLEIF